MTHSLASGPIGTDIDNTPYASSISTPMLASVLSSTISMPLPVGRLSDAG
ncbi:MAG: hypothetical protein M3P91_07655 [Actinomycetota bacterium]|nr:hypothetical protein [Actinomycetota bacterium]